MATGGEEKVGYSLVKVLTLKLEKSNAIQLYDSIVICQDKIIVDYDYSNPYLYDYPYDYPYLYGYPYDYPNTSAVNIYGLRDGKLLGILPSYSKTHVICLMDATTICFLGEHDLMQLTLNNSEIVPPDFTRRKSLRPHDHVFDYYHSVVRVKDKLVVVGVKEDKTCWRTVSLDDGHVDTIYHICKRSGRSSVTTNDNIIYFSCYADVDTGVYAFDILNPSKRKYNYQHQRLDCPTSIVTNENGNIFVGNGKINPCIHQLTASCQLVAIFNEGIPRDLQAMFWDNGRLYVACYRSPDITVFSHVYQEGSQKHSEFLMSHEKKQTTIVETSKEIEQGNVDKSQSSEDIKTHPSVQIPMDYTDGKHDNLTEDRICHLLSNESDLKAYLSNVHPEACIKTLLSRASKLSSKESMKIILDFIVLQFTERFSEKRIRVWAGEDVIRPENVQNVLVCFYSGSCDQSLESFYDLKVIYRDYNETDKESALARDHEREVKKIMTLTDCDLINEAITIHGKDLFEKHSNLEAISSSVILSSKSRGLEQKICVILYCRVKGIIPFGEMPFPKTLDVNENDRVTVDVREGYFLSHADSRNTDQEKTFHHESQQQTEPLRMGSNVGLAGSHRDGGTIGPFVKINSNKIGFLTCAHVVCSLDELEYLYDQKNTVLLDKEIVLLSDTISSNSSSKQPNRKCGKLLNAVFCGNWKPPSSAEEFGIDAALIEITSGVPITGEFVEIKETQLIDADLKDLKEPLKFDTGAMMSYPISGENRNAIKIGGASGLTRGNLQFQNGSAKYSMPLERINKPITMHKLMEIHSVSKISDFSKHGDSGAGVFLVGRENELTCVGLLFGSLTDKIGLAIPIDKILTALHCGHGIPIMLMDFGKQTVV